MGIYILWITVIDFLYFVSLREKIHSWLILRCMLFIRHKRIGKQKRKLKRGVWVRYRLKRKS